jgi:hypothetical protein
MYSNASLGLRPLPPWTHRSLAEPAYDACTVGSEGALRPKREPRRRAGACLGRSRGRFAYPAELHELIRTGRLEESDGRL